MKQISIRTKLVFWFTVALLVMALVTSGSLILIEKQIVHKGIRDSLIETVTRNLDEIRYYDTIESVEQSYFGDFVPYQNGYLGIDDDFLDELNQVYTALYQAERSLIYGENPISRESASLKLLDHQIQTVQVEGMTYYVFDRKLDIKGLDELWLRGIVSEAEGTEHVSGIVQVSLILLPTLLLIAAVGGYLLTKRMLRPIQQITDTARQIGQGDDLKKRIALGTGDDELHQLANSFDEMFARLDSSFEAQRQFVSDASHELRTPMAVISAQCELSLAREQTPEEYHEALTTIRRQSKKLSKLIADMLDFTRLETNTARYEKEELSFSELVESVCTDMAMLGERGIRLTWEVPNSITYCGNRELLARLLVNLVSNAYRYGKDNGYIRVTLTQGEAIALSVADDGIGIAAEEQEKIFRRFYQAEQSRTGVGTGLGLSMAEEIARFHGGALTVESTLGKGSIFTLHLPK